MARLYVGNLPGDIREREVDDLFYKYGRIRDIQVKTPSRPPSFAFVTFEDSRDAEDAVRGRDGYSFAGSRLRVEFAKGDRRSRDDRPSTGGRSLGSRKTNFGVLVSDLPRSCSWQDLKDFGRKAGDVVYADVDKNGEGIIDFSNKADMENAVRILPDSEFKNRYDRGSIRIRYANNDSDDKSDGSRSGSRDRRSRSPDRGRGRDRSASRSNSRRKSRSTSRSPSERGSNSSPKRGSI